MRLIIFNKKYTKQHVDKLNSQIDKAHARIEALEAEIRGHDDLTLEVKWLKALINDDEAICEVIDAAEVVKKARRDNSINSNGMAIDRMRARERGLAGLQGRQQQQQVLGNSLQSYG